MSDCAPHQASELARSVAGRSSSPSHCSPLWRSGASGLWYQQTASAGRITAIKCEKCGDMLERHDEQGLKWIKHVAKWWNRHTANDKSSDREQ